MKNSIFKYSCLFITFLIILVGLGCISAADTGSNMTSDTSGISAGASSQDNVNVISEKTIPGDKQVSMNNVNSTGREKKNTGNLKNNVSYNSSEYMYSNSGSKHEHVYNSSSDDNFNNYYPDVQFYKKQGDRFFKNVSISSYNDIERTIDNTDQYLLIINLKNGTYTSTGNITADNVMHNYIINGNNQTVNGNQSQLISIGSNSSLVLNNIHIINASVTGSGVIYNNGTLIINSSVLTSNNATNGGIIYNLGTLIINDSVITDNNAFGRGIIYNKGKVLINNSVLSGNHAVNGSIVYNDEGTVVMNNSRLSGNNAVNGGIYNSFNLRVNNSTLDNNTATRGGAVYNDGGNTQINYSDMINNTAAHGGVIYNTGGNVLIDNSQLTSNHATRGGTVYNKEYNTYQNNQQIHINSNLTITNTKFISNNDNMHELIYNNHTNTPNTLIIKNNTYTGNYLKTSTSTKPANKKLNNTDYTAAIEIKTEPVYNTTINTGNINIIINNKLYKKIPVKNSKAIITIPVEDFTQQDNNITYIYSSPDKSYLTLRLENNIIINKTYITLTDIKEQLGNTIKINATIRNPNNKTITNGLICIKINNKTFGYTNITKSSEITYNLKLTPENFGKYNYNLTICYGGTKNIPSAHKTVKLTITPYTPKIVIQPTTNYIGDTSQLKIKISNGTTYNALSGNIRFKLNNKTYKINGTPLKVQVTNGTAILKFYTSKKFVGTNNITILYSGNGKFKSIKTTINNTYIVKNARKTIINTHIITGELEKNTTLTATFTDQLKKPLKTGTVIIKINGKTITHTTIKNGQIEYKLYLDPKKYNPKNYTITFKFQGKGTQLPATTNTTLKIEKITPTFKYNKTTAQKGTTAKIILKIENNNTPATGTIELKINGKTVKINNKPYTTNLTNNTATFNIPITDNMKTSNITFTYSGDKKYEEGKTTIKDGLTITNSTRTTSLFVQLEANITKETINNWTKTGITDLYVQAKASTNNTKQLNNIINLTQKTNIKVHAWIICFATDNGIDTSTTQQNMIKNFITQIIKIDGVKGICLDYVRYDGTNISETNQTLITNFVKSVNNIVKEYDKNIELSACLFPEGYATAIYYGQNYTALSPYLDVELIMAYKYDYNKDSDWLASITAYVVSKAKYSKVVTILQTYDKEYHPLSANELTNDAKEVIKAGSSGYSLFRYGLINDYPVNAENITI